MKFIYKEVLALQQIGAGMDGLKDIYQPYFKIGAAVNTRTIVKYSDLIKKHFNSITCENEMKYNRLYSGHYTFDDADKIACFAEENNIELHGHTLVWHNQTPDIIFNNSAGELIETLKNHVAVIKERYGKNMHTIDVVNEAIEDKSDQYLRETKWKEKLGDNYIAQVFRLTKEIMPDVNLYYNDYNESVPNKRDKIIRLVKNLQEEGVPIDGIGLQSHHNIYTPKIDEVKRSIEMYAELGLQLHISEMDVSLFAFEDETKLDKPDDELLEKQAIYYKECFAIYREYHKHIDRVTLWGISDADTWLNHFPVRNRKNWPMLFDDNQQPKKAFYYITDITT